MDAAASSAGRRNRRRAAGSGRNRAAGSHRSLAGLRRNRVAAVILAGMVAVAVAGCGGSGTGAKGSSPVIVHLDDASPAPGLRGTQLSTPLPKPDITLTDTTGQPLNLRAATAGRLTLVYFGYTHCPDVCPTTMADVAAGLSETSADIRSKVAVVFITTDPERDTPGVLKSWLAQFNPSFIGLTGTPAQITGYARDLGITVEAPRRQADGSWLVDHSSQLTAFGPDGPARYVYLAGVTPVDYAHDIPMLVKGS